MPQNLSKKKINIGSGNGFVRSDDQPLPDGQVLWRNLASLGHNELTSWKAS